MVSSTTSHVASTTPACARRRSRSAELDAGAVQLHLDVGAPEELDLVVGRPAHEVPREVHAGAAGRGLDLHEARSRRGREIDVALGEVRPADRELADGPARDGAAVVVAHPRDDLVQGASDGHALRVEAFEGARDRELEALDAGLGRPVAVHEAVGPADDARRELDVELLAPDVQQEVRRRQPPRRQEQAQARRRNEEPVGPERVEHRAETLRDLPLVSGGEVDLRPTHERREVLHEAHVGGGRVVRDDAHARLERRRRHEADELSRERRVADFDALGLPRRARGEDDVRGGPGARGGGRRLEGVDVRRQDDGGVLRGPGGPGFGEDGRHAAASDHGGEPFGRRVEIEEHRALAGPPRADERRHVVRVAAERQRHARRGRAKGGRRPPPRALAQRGARALHPVRAEARPRRRRLERREHG